MLRNPVAGFCHGHATRSDDEFEQAEINNDLG
jgi:hypothetical protein